MAPSKSREQIDREFHEAIGAQTAAQIEADIAALFEQKNVDQLRRIVAAINSPQQQHVDMKEKKQLANRIEEVIKRLEHEQQTEQGHARKQVKALQSGDATQENESDLLTKQSVSSKTAEEIKADADFLFHKKDLVGLTKMRDALEGLDVDHPQYRKKLRVAWRIDGLIEVLQKDQEMSDRIRSRRVASITDGLHEELKHDLDLNAFKQRVSDLFDWYEQDQLVTHMAPYFPIVQSSGTGKTRLLVAFRDTTRSSNEEYDCMSVLCMPQDSVEVEDRERYFDTTFRVLRITKGNNSYPQRVNVIHQLMNILGKSTKEKLVLLFDEAQHLLTGDGSAFQYVRWWLREKRIKLVVAVFAGTTTKLANLYIDPPPSTSSRDPQFEFYNDAPSPRELYKPFFHLFTVGCFHDDCPIGPSNLDDFQSAAFFGRPLFAVLQKQDKFSVTGSPENGTVINLTLYNILKRLLVIHSSWKDNSTALCSILGSRVQMGITTTFDVASDLVSKGYAHLVHFHQDKDGDIDKAVARICFMPDPVAAALAMGMMNENWKLASAENGVDNFTGMDKSFWSRQAMKLLTSGLCLAEKGNPGEIMTALYMLFCGDVLRFAIDKRLRSFSVSLADWYSLLLGNTDDVKMPSNKSKTVSMEVNFIQVCRNNLQSHSWMTQSFLEFMFKSATAYYVDPDCEAIDMVAPIRIGTEGSFCYRPLLVSVKCWVKMQTADILHAIQNMKDLISDVRKTDSTPSALCLLVLIGADNERNIPNLPDDLGSANLGNFPNEDTFRMLSVPASDQFGVSSALREMTNAHTITDIFSSHMIINGETFEKWNDSIRESSERKTLTFVEDVFRQLVNVPPNLQPGSSQGRRMSPRLVAKRPIHHEPEDTADESKKRATSKAETTNKYS